MSDKIEIIWSIDDVKAVACDNFAKPITLTDKECRDVLSALKCNHDATIGINWDVIEAQIELFASDRDKNN